MNREGRLTVRIPSALNSKLLDLIESGIYQSKGAFIREALRDKIMRDTWKLENALRRRNHE